MYCQAHTGKRRDDGAIYKRIIFNTSFTEISVVIAGKSGELP
jgi:hypothetical protein